MWDMRQPNWHAHGKPHPVLSACPGIFRRGPCAFAETPSEQHWEDQIAGVPPRRCLGHPQKGQRGFIGSLTSTLLKLPEAGLAVRCLLSGPWFCGARVPQQHDVSLQAACVPGRLSAQPHAAERAQAALLCLAGFSRVLVSLWIKGIQRMPYIWGFIKPLTGFHSKGY